MSDQAARDLEFYAAHPDWPADVPPPTNEYSQAGRKRFYSRRSVEMAERIVDFIGFYVEVRGYPPTVREIGQAVGLSSSSSVAGQLRKLRREGRVTFEDGKPRTLRIRQGASA